MQCKGPADDVAGGIISGVISVKQGGSCCFVFHACVLVHMQPAYHVAAIH